MKGRTLKIAAVSITLLAVILVSNRLGIVQGQQKKMPGEGFAAVPGLKGGQDVFGPYDPVQNWPKPRLRFLSHAFSSPPRSSSA